MLAKNLLHQTSQLTVLNQCENAYISSYLEQILDQFEVMVLDEDIAKCRLCYQLTSRIDGGNRRPLMIFENHCTSCAIKVGKELISNSKDPNMYIDALLQLRDRFFSFCSNAFDREPYFEAAVDKVTISLYVRLFDIFSTKIK
jgi:hypothetical protein